MSAVMTRRNAVWIALTVGMATVVALMIADRLRRRPAIASATDWAPDPGPESIATAATSTGDAMADTATSAQLATEVRADVAAEPEEQPLPMWVRLTIVGVALLAFLAISLIATKSY
jgi:hypothetical protein